MYKINNFSRISNEQIAEKIIRKIYAWSTNINYSLERTVESYK